MGTFASYLTDGSGATAYRVVIEGCKYEFVTDPVMEGAIGDGRYRVRGLKREGISITESVYMAGAELNLKLSSLQITETDGPYLDAATEVFSGFSSDSGHLTYLADTFAIGDGFAKVKSAAAITAGQIVHIGTAAWRVDSIDLSGDASLPDTIHITETMWRTFDQGFVIATATSTSTSEPVLIEITSTPANFAGRRVWLYGHGTSELGVGDTGTLLWRGLLAMNPELSDVGTWSLSMQSRLSLFDTEIGKAAAGGTKLRGAYYSAVAPMSIGFNLLSGPQSSSSSSAAYQFFYYGFNETQDAFCSDLQNKLRADATLTSWGGTWSVRPTDSFGFGGSSSWDLFYTPDAISPKWVIVEGGSGVDGGFTMRLLTVTTFSGRTGYFAASTVAINTEYKCEWAPDGIIDGRRLVPAANCRQVPRANYAGFTAFSGTSEAARATYPLRRFYLDFTAALASWGTVKITPPTPEGSTETPAAIDAQVGVYSVAGYVEITDTAVDMPQFQAAGSYGPTFELTTLYGPITSPTGCTLAQFMQAIVDAAPTTANIGAPFILSDDVADWTNEVAAASSGITSLQRRLYSFAKPKKLIDVLKEEWKLHGLVPCLDSDGKIAVRRLPGSDSTTPSLTIDSTVFTPGDDDFGTMKLSPNGIVSSVELKSGYVSADDKWLNDWTFNALGSAAATKGKGQALTISPYARPYVTTGTDGGDIPITDASLLFGRVLSLFGKQYYHVDLPVSLAAHPLRIGDEVLVTIRQLPFAGARGSNTSGAGMANVRAFVVGRDWKYGDSPGGTLTLLMSTRNTAGYAPTARVATATGAGVSWTFHCNDDFYGPRRFDASATRDAAFFAAGYTVVVREFDADSPATYTGTVASVSGDDIAITFDAAFPGLLGRTMDISFGASQVATAGQRAYTYMADPTGRIAYATGGSAPRQFA